MIEAESIRALESRMGGLDLRTAEAELDRCARDRSPFRRRPVAVCVPRDAGELCEAVAAAAATGVPITARAGGSSVAGQCLGAGLVVEVTRLTGIEPGEDESVWCGAGETLDAVNARLAGAGRTIGPDAVSSPWARIGGLVATNACGARSMVHGRFGDALLGAEVVLCDGDQASLAHEATPVKLARALAPVADGLAEALADWPSQPRTPGGYRLPEFARRGDALSLVPGSEGTLCLIARARLATAPLPRRRALTLAAFSGLRAALDAAPAMAGTAASAVEVLDIHLLTATRGAGLDLDPAAAAALLVEHLDEAADLGPALAARAAAGALAVERLDGEAAERAWRLRGSALELVAAGGTAPLAIFEDPAVSPERAGGFCEALLELLSGFGLEAMVYGHAAAGCLHVRPLCDPSEPRLAQRLLSAAEAVCELVGEWGGALTGEHGWGLARSHLAPRALGPLLYERCAAVKHAFDPGGVLNPGMIVGGHDPGPLFDPVERAARAA